MMKKLTFLFLTLIFALPLTMKAETAKEKRDDTRYLAGAVPEVDGKVVFSKEFQIPGMSQEEIYRTVTNWMEERLQENKNINSRIVYSDKEKGMIAGIGEEWIVFSSSALSLDRTLINYQLTVTCQPNSLTLDLEKIRFTYRDTEKYKAEEWITDKYALNKTKTKLIRGLAKWRRKTVDFADDTFMDLAVAFGARDTRPRVERKKEKEEASTAPSLVTSAGPIVIGETVKAKEITVGNAAGHTQNTNTGNNKTAISQAENKTAQTTVSQVSGKVSAEMPAYIEIDLKQIPGEVYALMGSSRLVISIGTDEFNMTNMTANAGGAIGYQSGKAVAYCTLSADQNHEAIDKANTYKLKLYNRTQTKLSEPLAIIECKKLPSQAVPQAGQPCTFVGEIVKLLLKK